MDPLRRILPPALLLAAALFAGGLLHAQIQSNSAENILRPAVADQAGRHDSSTGNSKLGGAGGLGVANSTSSSSSNQVLALGLLNVMSYPNPVTTLSGLASVGASTVTLVWTSPGYDGEIGALQIGTTYFIRVASFTVPDTFSLSYADVFFSTEATVPGLRVSTPVYNLLPNTTYFIGLWTKDAAGNLSFLSNRSTDTTLANAPSLSAPPFFTVHFTSIAAQWTAMPASPPDASSASAQGYTLEASSTNFGALLPGGVVYSSSTQYLAANLLTAGADVPLEGCTTHYFRVASLNWRGAPNYTILGSTRNNDIGVVVSTHDLNIGSFPLNTEVLISTSFLVTNPVCAGTFSIMATTITAGSPWEISTASGTDTFTLQAIFDGDQPASGDFTEEDKLTDTPAESTATRFSIGGQTGVNVPQFGSRLLWLKLGLPRITSTDLPQSIRVTVIAIPP